MYRHIIWPNHVGPLCARRIPGGDGIVSLSLSLWFLAATGHDVAVLVTRRLQFYCGCCFEYGGIFTIHSELPEKGGVNNVRDF